MVAVSVRGQTPRCDPPCSECTNDGICLECSEYKGFDFFGFCRGCVGCAECRDDYRTCTACADSGYYVADGGCDHYPEYYFCTWNCMDCDSRNPYKIGNCSACYPNFGKIGTACLRCKDPRCSDCRGDVNSCFKCFPQFGFASAENRTCLPCGDDRCEDCASDFQTCKSCMPGFGVDPTTRRCVPCTDVNCNLCGSDSTVCQSCTDGYGKNKGNGTASCLPCPAHCTPDGCSTDARVCKSCLRGFNLAASGTCELIKRKKVCSPHAYSCGWYDWGMNICDAGFGIMPNGSCLPCIEGCASCSGNYWKARKCFRCFEGWEKNNMTWQCTRKRIGVGGEVAVLLQEPQPEVQPEVQQEQQPEPRQAVQHDQSCLVENCLYCRSGQCEYCNDSFVLVDNACVACPANCATQRCEYVSSTQSTRCSACQDGFLLSADGTCNERCPPGCRQCKKRPGSGDIVWLLCISCLDGHKMEFDRCDLCEVGHVISPTGDGSCMKYSCPANCHDCRYDMGVGKVACTKCFENYGWAASIGKCVPLPWNCVEVAANGEHCGACFQSRYDNETGFALVDGKCRACPAGCSRCSLDAVAGVLRCDECASQWPCPQRLLNETFLRFVRDGYKGCSSRGYILKVQGTCSRCPKYCAKCSYVGKKMVCDRCRCDDKVCFYKDAKGKCTIPCEGCAVPTAWCIDNCKYDPPEQFYTCCRNDLAV